MKFAIENLSSKQNPKIKNLLNLQKNSERAKQNLFVVEGIKEIEKLLHSSHTVDSVFFCPDIIREEEIYSNFLGLVNAKLFSVTRDIFNKIAYREDSGGMVVLAKPSTNNLSNLRLDTNPLILVIEGIEKPGNIGAIYRTADAAGVSAIIICNPGTDIYNPNAIRSSLGCIFTMQTAVCSGIEAINWLKLNEIKIYTSYLQAAIPYYRADFRKPSAIVMGTESTGVSELWIKSSDANIIIPMRGMVDSMNVSTAAAVLVFEACRQRFSV